MARGNDGNLLQHGIEAQIAAHLATEQGLHIVCTHGMSPFEPWELPGRHRRLLRWIERSASPPTVDEPAVVRAYRKLRVSPERYPNTGEVVAALLARRDLTGFICEVEPEKHQRLKEAWSGSGVTPLLGSWRVNVGTIQSVLPGRPWLFAMDPMTFRPDRDDEPDDDQLYPKDLHDRLVPTWRRFLVSGQPGAIALFCFELRRGPGPNQYQLFQEETEKLAITLGVSIERFEVSYGNPHVGAILTSDVALLERLRQCWRILHDVR